jgi:hypothetical protein
LKTAIVVQNATDCVSINEECDSILKRLLVVNGKIKHFLTEFGWLSPEDNEAVNTINNETEMMLTQVVNNGDFQGHHKQFVHRINRPNFVLSQHRSKDIEWSHVGFVGLPKTRHVQIRLKE